MRHAYTFPPEVREAVRRYVHAHVSALDPLRYQQEHAFMSALFARLDGVAYDGRHGKVVFINTVVSDRGSGTAESWSGADGAVTAEITANERTIRKAILAQAKIGPIQNLAKRERSRLYSQIRHMKKLTRAPQILDFLERNGARDVRVISANRLLEGGRFRPRSLADYLINRVLPTLDGDTRRQFVERMQKSDLALIRIEAELDLLR